MPTRDRFFDAFHPKRNQSTFSGLLSASQIQQSSVVLHCPDKIKALGSPKKAEVTRLFFGARIFGNRCSPPNTSGKLDQKKLFAGQLFYSHPVGAMEVGLLCKKIANSKVRYKCFFVLQNFEFSHNLYMKVYI